jgi:outer membrane protein assembly factor BamD
MNNWLFLVFFSLALLPACVSNKKSLREHKGTYLESVKLNYEAGQDLLKKQEYDKAIAYFQFVRSKYPFSQYVALSDLRIADVKYAQKKWLDAASAYEIFIRLHPRHEETAYASFRLGSSYYHAIPSDFFLWPSSSSRDQSFTKEALSAIERFIYSFPDSEHQEEASRMRLLLFSKLAQANLQIAAYYQRRNRHEAAIARYLSVNELYPEAKESAQSLFEAALIAEKDLKDLERAKQIYGQIIEQKAESSFAKLAQKELLRLENS